MHQSHNRQQCKDIFLEYSLDVLSSFPYRVFCGFLLLLCFLGTTVDVFEGIWSAGGSYSSNLPHESSSINNGQSVTLVRDEETPFQASLSPYRESTTDMNAALVPDFGKDSTPSTKNRRGRGRSNGRKFDSRRD